MLALAIALLSQPAQAAQAALQAEQAAGTGKPVPYRGTRLALRTTANALAVAPGAELTYNPYTALTFQFVPMWWFNDSIYFAGALEATRELSHSDWTTYEGEVFMEDAVLQVGGDGLWQVPWVGIELSAAGNLVLPTSKRSQGESLWFATGAELSLSRTFADLGEVVRWIEVAYVFAPSKSFHAYTTSSYQGPTVADCATSARGCEPFLHSGQRNVSWSLQNSLQGRLDLLDFVTFDLELASLTGFLYPLAQAEGASYSVANPVNERYLNYARFAAILRPAPAIHFVIGASTLSPQLQPNGYYYTPFINRYTNVYVDVRLNPAGLLSQLHDAGV